MLINKVLIFKDLSSSSHTIRAATLKEKVERRAETRVGDISKSRWRTKKGYGLKWVGVWLMTQYAALHFLLNNGKAE